MSIARLGAHAAIICLGSLAWADGDLANTASSGIREARSWSIDVRGNFHRSAEDRTYTSFGFRYGLQPGWEIGVRGSFAPVGNANTIAAIRTGGSDIELMARYALPEVERLVFMGGVAFPNTPAQDKPFFTYGATYGLQPQEGGPRLYVGGRGVWRSGNSIAGLSAGAEMPVGQNIELFGDITAIVHGDNTRDTVNGQAMRQAIWGVGARYNFTSVGESGFNGSLFLMLGNGLGTTTGMSLSTALGNRPALTIGFSLRGKS